MVELGERTLPHGEHDQHDEPEPGASSAPPSEPEPACDDPTWDVVDEASWESFPASDPPGW